jgi:hypothetical protein
VQVCLYIQAVGAHMITFVATEWKVWMLFQFKMHVIFSLDWIKFKYPQTVPTTCFGLVIKCPYFKGLMFSSYYILPFLYIIRRSRGSSVSIVSGYGLDDRAIEVRSLAGSRDFSSNFCVQTGSGAHPASCTMGTGCHFPRSKARLGRETDHPPPSSAEVVNE